jgi:crotonobetainyl-CoA:carnitine CoA-transferase CaiB-like acyl-CoA transferase
VVADLSALWAGPLVGRLLGDAGARVIKVESPSRADGARFGDPEFYERLNGGKASLALDLDDRAGRELLARMVERVDVVITSSRLRALEQLGLDPAAVVRQFQPRVWLTISGYGPAAGDRDRVAFGDDAAVAGGLVAWDGPTPCFCGDAIADPLTGLAATGAVLAALEGEGAWVIDASMADVAAGAAGVGPALPMDGLPPVPPPLPGHRSGRPASGLGADNASVLAELGLG